MADLLVRLSRARAVLRHRDGSVGNAAAAASMSLFHFTRLFRAWFGQPPHQYRIDSRLDRAKRLLVLTDLPVTDVCLEVGFRSLGSFSALFHRRVGASPSAYRARYRGKPELAAPSCLGLLALAYAQQDPRSEPGTARTTGDPEATCASD